MKNAAERQRLPNQQQAKQHYTPLIKALRMLKVEWLCFSSFFLGNTPHLIFYLSVLVLLISKHTEMAFMF